MCGCAPAVDASDLEAEMMPALRRGRGRLLARALGRSSVPDWLTRPWPPMAPLRIDDLLVDGAHFTGLARPLAVGRARGCNWRAAALRSGAPTWPAGWRSRCAAANPSYRLTGSVKGFNWQSGKLDAEGTLDTAGVGPELLANLKSGPPSAGRRSISARPPPCAPHRHLQPGLVAAPAPHRCQRQDRRRRNLHRPRQRARGRPPGDPAQQRRPGDAHDRHSRQPQAGRNRQTVGPAAQSSKPGGSTPYCGRGFDAETQRRRERQKTKEGAEKGAGEAGCGVPTCCAEAFRQDRSLGLFLEQHGCTLIEIQGVIGVVLKTARRSRLNEPLRYRRSWFSTAATRAPASSIWRRITRSEAFS